MRALPIPPLAGAGEDDLLWQRGQAPQAACEALYLTLTRIDCRERCRGKSAGFVRDLRHNQLTAMALILQPSWVPEVPRAREACARWIRQHSGYPYCARSRGRASGNGYLDAENFAARRPLHKIAGIADTACTEQQGPIRARSGEATTFASHCANSAARGKRGAN